MSQPSLPAKERKNWIDWMKVLGMFFIVWGHSWPESMCPFIYAFNVPVFFLISGYLSKREESFLLDKVTGKALRMLSAGTIVILGFHRDIANPLEKPLEIFSQGSLEWDGGTFFVSILVMLAFIPIIWFVKRFLPFLLGKRSF